MSKHAWALGSVRWVIDVYRPMAVPAGKLYQTLGLRSQRNRHAVPPPGSLNLNAPGIRENGRGM